VNDHPGTCGAAARLPKNPGIQKLTPSSSAIALFGIEKIAAAVASAITATAKYRRRLYCGRVIKSPALFHAELGGKISIANTSVLI
jgi:hypothetical protein